MKFAKFTAVALLAAIFAVGCNEEKVSFGNEGDDTFSNKGYLLMSDIVVDCRVVESNPDGGLNPNTSALSTRTTRATVDASNFDCSIINEENEVVMSFKFGERPTEAVELETGDYIFEIQSGEIPGAAWDTPIYGTSKAFKIVRNETTKISEIVCSLMQIQVSISYSQDLRDRLGDKTITTVRVGNNSLEYSLNETRSGFFLAPQLNNTIEISISGTYAADLVTAKPINMTKEIKDVTAGQYSKVHFYIEHSAEGNINVGVTIQDWVTDEIIPCNVADKLTEEEWKEEESGDVVTPAKDPSIEWVGYNLADRVTIDDTTTGEIMVRASKGIKELVVQIESEVLVPALLGSIGLADVMNITHPEKSYDSSNPSRVIDTELLKKSLSVDFGFPICDEVIGKTEVLFSITTFMGALNAEAGNHNFHFTVIDNEGTTLTEILKLKSTGM